jgi:hypothetical protein
VAGCYRLGIVDVYVAPGMAGGCQPARDRGLGGVGRVAARAGPGPAHRACDGPPAPGHPGGDCPVVLAGAVDGARAGYRTARTELGEAVPPHAIDAALTAYRDLGRQMARDARAAELVERALRGEAT